MNWKTAAVLFGLALSASVVKAEIRNFSTVDVKTSAPINWRRLPSGEDLRRYYPASALQKRVEGHATISCSVNQRGLFYDCLKLNENPQGLGFGDAAVKMAPLYKLNLEKSAAGDLIAPATPVTFEVRFPPPLDPPA
jgi:hypothetical protein